MRIKVMAATAAMGMLAAMPAGAQAAGPDSAETVWALRSALNVAALGCRGPEEASTVAGYNAMLATEKTELAEALAAVSAGYKARYGAAWQARFDDAMTRAYNHWASPGAHDGFCAAAEAALRDVATVEPSDFAAFAAAALPQLEAPFAAPMVVAAAAPAAPAAAPPSVVLASAIVP